jgi:pimeloyl-ACP methyl ester carboxylesterase
VTAVDLPGISQSGAPAGYDAATVADCFAELCTELDHDDYAVLAIDAAVPAAFVLVLTCPERVRAAMLMEGLVPGLPGADDFLGNGPPWWFGSIPRSPLERGSFCSSTCARIARAEIFNDQQDRSRACSAIAGNPNRGSAERLGLDVAREGKRNSMGRSEAAALLSARSLWGSTSGRSAGISSSQ